MRVSDEKADLRYFSDSENKTESNNEPSKSISTACPDDIDDDNDDDDRGAKGRCGGCRLPPWRVMLTVTACTLSLATVGINYIRGNMMPYVTSYMRNVTGDTSVNYARMLWLGNTGWISYSVSLPFLGLLSKWMSHHQRLYIFIGISLHICSHIGSYFAVQQSFGVMIAFNGLLPGLAQAMIYPACLRVSIQWFPHRRGLIGGITMSGFGVGAFVWNQVITMWINPDNLQPDLTEGENLYFTQHKVLDKVPSCYLVLGGILTSIQLLCLASIAFPPPVVTIQEILPDGKEVNPNEDEIKLNCVTQDRDSHPPHATDNLLDPRETGWDNVNRESGDAAGQGETQKAAVAVEEGKGQGCCAKMCQQQETDSKNESVAEGEDGRKETESVEYGPLQILKCPVTWLLYINDLAVDLAFIFIVSFYKTYGQTFIHNDHLLSLVGSIASISNAVGRPVWGLIADRIGFLPALMLNQTVLMVTSATLVTSELAGSSAMFFIWVCLMYESMGGMYALQGATISCLFGFKYFAFSFGIISSSGLLTCFSSTAMADFLLPLFGWTSIYYAAAAILMLGMVVMSPLLITCGPGTCIPRHLQTRLMAKHRGKSAK